MSEEKNSNQTTDSDLDDLLNSALEDFQKLPKPSSQKDDSTSRVAEIPSDEELADETWSQDFIKQTAEQLEKNFQTLLQNGGGTEEGETFQKMAQTVASAIGGGNLSDLGNESIDFQGAIAQALKGISAASENLQNAGPEMTEADLTAMFGQTGLEENPEDYVPFMQGIMQYLLSKEVLYSSLKELSEKYPAWLEEKKSSLSTEDLTRYTKQFDLMQKVCNELDKEKEDDSKDIKKRRFDIVLALMQEMQGCGPPPEELAGDQSMLQFDGEGIPGLAGLSGLPGMPSLPPGVDPQNCSIM